MKIQKKLFLCVSFIVVSFLFVIALVSFSFMRVMEYKNDIGMALSTYAKWSALNNTTKVLLMADKDHNEAFENWRSSLREFTEQHEQLVDSKRIREMGYEMEGIVQQSQGLWGFYRIMVDQVIDILDTEEGKTIFSILDSNRMSIVTIVEREPSLAIDPAIMKDIKKIREILKFRRNTASAATEATQTSAEDDFNWLWNNSFIPLLESEIHHQMKLITVWSIAISLIIILVTVIFTLIIVRSITRPLQRFLTIFMEGAKGDLTVRYPIVKRSCTAIRGCTRKECVAYGNPDTVCFVGVGSYAPLLGNTATCPHIVTGEVKECGECSVYKTICREEMSMAGAWFNVLVGNLDRSVKVIQEAQLIWQKSMSSNQVQRSLLPLSTLDGEPWDVASYFKAASEVSGNFHDYYFMDNHLKGVGLFNVAGHGISTALVTVIAKSLMFRLFNRMHTSQLGKVIKNAIEALNHEVGQADQYLTGILIRVKPELIEFVNTGMPNVLLRKAGREGIDEIQVRQSVISGSLSTIEETKREYQDLNFTMDRQDFILLHTEGLSGALNGRGEAFGTERVKQTLLKAPASESAKVIMEFLMEEVHRFVGKPELSNDVTAIILKRK
jgi:serine phosphatase RsbU (regulator of sigma subunit)